MSKHEPTQMVYAHRSNQKHAHNTRHGVRYRNHWFDVQSACFAQEATDHLPRRGGEEWFPVVRPWSCPAR
jgi:hypothetical protein